MLSAPPSHLQVPGGKLMFTRRDGRFAYFYEVFNHPLTQGRCPRLMGRTFVYLQDTYLPAMARELEFEKLLTVKLGPDDMMAETGLFEIVPKILLLLSPELIAELLQVQQDILGPEDEITPTSFNSNGSRHRQGEKFTVLYYGSIPSTLEHNSLSNAAAKLMNDELELEEHHIRANVPQGYYKGRHGRH
ncbi:hypothetical protein Hypma_005594 [Hypsizygus marmoreus]|uniref:Uncharacterized protein n=1 Tax=Hypsizygus marmoreus TaxID=39966 RepID=A0A369JXW4_HYPMA|nr:hypothetical protein Hypma_005594 [Hypsizygus marmoreus]